MNGAIIIMPGGPAPVTNCAIIWAYSWAIMAVWMLLLLLLLLLLLRPPAVQLPHNQPLRPVAVQLLLLLLR
jgi:hypothetical protein